MNHQDAWKLLDDYLDCALPAEARWRLTIHLEDCPCCRKQLAAQARLRGEVRDTLVAVEPPPGLSHRLRAALAAEAPAPTPRMVAWPPPLAMQIAALLGPALVAVLLLARLGAPLASTQVEPGITAAVSHALFAQDEDHLDVEGDAAAVTAWFRDEIGVSTSAPELDGYELLGARMIVLAEKPVAQLVYESEDEVYLSLVRVDARSGWRHSDDLGAEPTLLHYGTLPVVTWVSGTERNALMGEAPSEELLALAQELAGA